MISSEYSLVGGNQASQEHTASSTG